MRVHQSVIVIPDMSFPAPYPPCYHCQSTQDYGTTDADNHTNDDSLGGGAEARAVRVAAAAR